MASAPTPAVRPIVSYQDAYEYKPKFNQQDQCYYDHRITLKEFKSYGKNAIKCGICDGFHVFATPSSFNVHMKSDKHQKKLKLLNDRLFMEDRDRNATPTADMTISEDGDENSTITTETPMPALEPIKSQEPEKPEAKPEPPTPIPASDLYHTVLLAEIDRLNRIIRQKDTQLAHLKQTIVHLGEYFRYEEAL